MEELSALLIDPNNSILLIYSHEEIAVRFHPSVSITTIDLLYTLNGY